MATTEKKDGKKVKLAQKFKYDIDTKRRKTINDTSEKWKQLCYLCLEKNIITESSDEVGIAKKGKSGKKAFSEKKKLYILEQYRYCTASEKPWKLDIACCESCILTLPDQETLSDKTRRSLPDEIRSQLAPKSTGREAVEQKAESDGSGSEDSKTVSKTDLSSDL
jgi:hypothetical protein